MTKVRIGERWVGDGEPAYIVAEAGSNHNGSFEQALRLIDAAADACADAVKFQQFKAAKLYPKSAGASDYLNTPRSIYDIIHDMETPDDWVPELAGHCRRRGLAFLSSPFDEESADLLDPWVPAFKVASYEMTHAPLLRHIARKGKPMIVSTGAAVLDEVLHSVEIIRAEGNDQIVLLQCTAKYPTPLDAVNARALVSLREATGLPTGLSDHSRDPVVAPVVAVALGACLIEKHFTLNHAWKGTDHAFSLEPDITRLIDAGLVDAAVVGGCDSLCLTTLYGFGSLELLSDRPCRPFDPDRNGISIGEGAGFALLQRAPGPGARATPGGEIVLAGVGESCDAYHMSTPHPEGLGATLAMQRALAAGGLAPEAVGYVNLHGTATRSNDTAEGNAVAKLFGPGLPCSATKGATGHLLGAAGIAEAIISMLSLRHEWLPGTANSNAVDPACGCRVLLEGERAAPRYVLSNSFGFGGNNCSLVFGRA